MMPIEMNHNATEAHVAHVRDRTHLSAPLISNASNEVGRAAWFERGGADATVTALARGRQRCGERRASGRRVTSSARAWVSGWFYSPEPVATPSPPSPMALTTTRWKLRCWSSGSRGGPPELGEITTRLATRCAIPQDVL